MRRETTAEESTANSAAIVCSGLTKDYGSGQGLFDLNLEVRRGEIFGFIGPNGAGKSTAIRLIMDLIRPDGGRARVLGLDAHDEGLAIKRRVGYLPGELPQYPGARAEHVIALLAGLRGGVDPARVKALAERLKLDLRRKYQDLSHGNKQKVGLVQAFMHRPELLVLDEPTLGLDPLMQREFWDLVDESIASGSTAFVSSHVLAELELRCDRIGLIREGHLLRVGTLEELREERVHRIEAIALGGANVADLAAVPGVSEPRVENAHVSCTVRGSIAPLLAWLSSREVVELDSRELSLEEVFLSEFESAP